VSKDACQLVNSQTLSLQYIQYNKVNLFDIKLFLLFLSAVILINNSERLLNVNMNVLYTINMVSVVYTLFNTNIVVFLRNILSCLLSKI